MDNLVFVYGTLKKGYGNWSWCLKGKSTFLGKHTTASEYEMLDLGAFPGVVLNGETSIKGELFGVDDQVMGNLDGLEGYPSFYNRKLIPTDKGEAWMYYLNSREEYHESVVKSGEWT